jgi:CDP-glycerol glycerophosphotransferase (TagB/SpsB family)
VQLFHGFNVSKRSDERGHFRIRGLFDLYCTQGPATTRPFEELARQHGHFLVRETGWPKLDPLFAGEPPRPGDRPTVFFGSTFTPSLSAAETLAPTIERLSQSGRWRWLVTLHPKMDRGVVERYRAMQNEWLTFIDGEDLVPHLRRGDVMLSDTSSIASEFLVQYRPVVTFRTRVPRPWLLDVREAGEVEGAIAHALEQPADLMAAVRRQADEIHPYRDGRSSERVLAATEEIIASGAHERLARKPLALWRRLEMRWRLRKF